MEKMKLILLTLIMMPALYAQVNIKIIVHTVKLNDSDKVYIAGNNNSLGNWNPGISVFNKDDDTTWSRIFTFNKNESIEFKFTLGTWSKEGLENEDEMQKNFHFQTNKDTTIEYRINYWGTNAIFKGQIAGHLEYFRDFEGKGINPRDISVWLPPDYYTDTTKKYSVIYAHDGQNLFDPNTSATGIDWQIDETADSLIQKQKMESVIIVGIHNTRQRTAEYSYSKLGYAYMKFIVEELKPFIDKNFRTLSDRENTATLGSSMGGLISFMLLWEYNDVFSKAASFSPAIKVHRFNYLPYVENYSGIKKNIKLYIDNGGIGIEQELQPGIDETIILLEKKGYIQGSDFIVFYDKDALHNEESWAKRVWRPLLFFFGKD